MTKAQLKQKYEAWNKEITKKEVLQKEFFHELQEMNYRSGDGYRWCSMTRNVEGLAKARQPIYHALILLGQWYEIEGEKEALKELAVSTSNFKI